MISGMQIRMARQALRWNANDLANKAGIKTLILHHLIPAPDNIVIKKIYEKETKNFNGKIHVANDGDKFVLK